MKRTRKSKAKEKLAGLDIGEIWEKTSTPGPSHQQWEAWNNEHGAMLRLACATMARDKDELAGIIASLGDEGSEEFLASLQRSAEFFCDMAEVVAAAHGRLKIGRAVYQLNPEKYQRADNVVLLAGKAVRS